MFKVNNKKYILKLAKSSFKANRLRNIFAVIAIMLTTVLFTGLFTITSSMVASMEESTMRQVGMNAQGGFKYLSQEEYDKLKTHPSIKEISYTSVLGFATNSQLAKRQTEIRYTYDNLAAKMTFSEPTTGRLPESDDEIAMDTIALDYLGITPELGQNVTLEYNIGQEKHADTFTLVGFWEGDKLMMASTAWLNRSYVENALAKYIASKGEPLDEMVGTIMPTFNFSNSRNIEDKILKVITESGYTKDTIKYGVNWAYAGNTNMDLGTILGFVGIIVIILFCGYLIISNVFLISIAKDISFYGMLKTIGTTGKQIKFLIRRQAVILSIIAVPLGLLAGYFVGVLIVPLVLKTLNTNVIKVDVNPTVFILSGVFAIITVFLSISKPSKIAAKVSPIEALRSTDAELGGKKAKKAKTKTRKNSTGSNIYQMAIGNIGRNKKKVISVTVSLSLGLIILNSAYTLANSFDMDKYLKAMIGTDFAIGDASIFNVHINYTNQETLNPDLLSTLKNQEGVEDINNIYFGETNSPKDARLEKVVKEAPEMFDHEANTIKRLEDTYNLGYQLNHIYGLDDNVFKRLEVLEGEIDLEKLKTGSYVIVNTYDEGGKLNYYNVGDKILLTAEDKREKEYEVLAIARMPYNITIQHSHPLTPSFYMTSDVFKKDIAVKAPMMTTVDVAKENEQAFETLLKEQEEIDNNLTFKSKSSIIEEYEGVQKSYKSIGLVVSLLIGFIGIMNFVNTTITSIISRKREIAMLQSIGMTNRQMEKMLITEGVIYAALTTIFALTIGSVIGYNLLNALMGGGYFTIKLTIIPSLICLPILAIIAIVVPLISQKMISKKSIVERLRENE